VAAKSMIILQESQTGFAGYILQKHFRLVFCILSLFPTKCSWGWI